MSLEYTRSEEIVNSVTHGLGILMGIGAGVILLYTAIINFNPWAITGVIAYLGGMLASYISSTCYHACTNKKRKAVLRKFDHSAIYLHIAGTYVPFTLVVLREVGLWGWSIFIFMAISALAGVIISFTNLKEHSNLETIGFVTMGCTILIAIKPLMSALGELDKMPAFYWLIAGGALYVTGAVFYSLTKIKFMHSVFHLFVLGGSVCHIISIHYIL